MWSFGFGSNMNVQFVTDKKGLTVLDSSCAVLKGWRVGFNFLGMSKVEPSWANAIAGRPEDEIHGVAIKLSAQDKLKLDDQEGAGPNRSGSGYRKIDVDVTTYDGKVLQSYIYSKDVAPGPDGAPIERPCSRRYLNILVEGAKSAGLQPEYIERLQALPTYTPSAETLALVRPSPCLAATTTRCAELCHTERLNLTCG